MADSFPGGRMNEGLAEKTTKVKKSARSPSSTNLKAGSVAKGQKGNPSSTNRKAGSVAKGQKGNLSSIKRKTGSVAKGQKGNLYWYP